jgi:hypothetical protein
MTSQLYYEDKPADVKSAKVRQALMHTNFVSDVLMFMKPRPSPDH